MGNLKIDLTGVETIETVEAGKYVAKVIDVEETESKAGNPMLAWSWEIQDKCAEGVVLKSFTSLMPNALFGLKGHLLALGANTAGKIDLNTKKLHGKKAVLTVSKSEDDKNRVESVKRYTPPATKASTSKAAPEVEEDEDDSPFEKEVEPVAEKKKKKKTPPPPPVEEEDDDDDDDDDDDEDDE